MQLKKVIFAEFIGTFIFLFLGCGCVAALKLGHVSYTQVELSLVWGLAVMIGVYIANPISGAHLNPAVSIALALFGNFPKNRLLPYIVAQFLGAFFAAAAVYFLYQQFFLQKDLSNAGIFATYPAANLSFAQAFLTELSITAVLLGVIFSITDPQYKVCSPGMVPFIVGLTVTTLGGAFGNLTGFAMNPARDFGPRFFTYCCGWGADVFTAHFSIPYCLIPIVAPILGGILGAFIYKALRTNAV